MQPLSQAVPRVLAELFRGSPPSPGKVECAWTAAVGPAVDRVTRVRLEGRVLLVEARSPQWTHEMQRSSRIILRRMQTLMGDDVIEELIVRA